jgi:hypothetical protein
MDGVGKARPGTKRMSGVYGGGAHLDTPGCDTELGFDSAVSWGLCCMMMSRK